MKEIATNNKVGDIVKSKCSSKKLKPWKVNPENNEGVLVSGAKKIRHSSGILITDHVIGNGAIPRLGTRVLIIYEGILPDGTVFDFCRKRRKPFVFRKGLREVIRGLDLGIETMKIGGSREIHIPSELGFV